MLFDLCSKLKTERCVLSNACEDDTPHVYSASHIKGFNSGMIWDPLACRDKQRISSKKSSKTWVKGQTYVFTVESNERNLIGRVSIRARGSKGLWSIGFWTHPQYEGKGLMTEVVTRVLKFGFEELCATEIEACHETWNNADKGLSERCGMVWRENIPKGCRNHGEWVAEDRFSITREALAGNCV